MGTKFIKKFYLVPPGSGICHQFNLENISKQFGKKITKLYFS